MNLGKLLESVLNEMGGNVFTTERIDRENIQPTIQQYKKQVLDKIPHQRFDVLGSVGKKASSGDIDIGFETNLSAEEICDKLEDIGVLCKNGGKQVWTSFPQYDSNGKTDKDVQIDLMLGDLDWMKSAYWAPDEKDSKYKGVHRNILLNAILRFASEEAQEDGSSTGFAVDWSSGINKKLRFKKIITRGKNKGQEKWDSKTVEKGVYTSWSGVADFLSKHTNEKWSVNDIEQPFEIMFDKAERSFDVSTFEKIKQDVKRGFENAELDVPEQLQEGRLFGFLEKLSEELLYEAKFGRLSGKGNPNRKVSGSSNEKVKEFKKALKKEFPEYKPEQLSFFDFGEYFDEKNIPDGGEVFYNVNNNKHRGILQVRLPDGTKTNKFAVINAEQNVYAASSNMTSKIHETCFGIFLRDPNRKIDNAEDYRKAFFEIYNLPESKLPQISSKQEEFPDDIIEDARKMARKFLDRFTEDSSISEIKWSADNTKENESTGPADVVAIYDDGYTQYISLKKGSGQLASLSAKDVADVIRNNIEGSLKNDSLLKWVERQNEPYSENISLMTQEWISMMIDMIEKDSQYEEADKQAFKEDIAKIKTYEAWTKIRSKHDTVADYFATQVTKGDKAYSDKWKEIRRKYLIPGMKDFIESELNINNIEEMEDKLKSLFKKSFRIFDKPYIYVADSGNKMFVVPAEDDFDEISENLSFVYEISLDSSDFKIQIKVKIKENITNKTEDLLKFDMSFRWTQKQMSNSFSSTTSAPKLIANDELVLEYLFPDRFK